MLLASNLQPAVVETRRAVAVRWRLDRSAHAHRGPGLRHGALSSTPDSVQIAGRLNRWRHGHLQLEKPGPQCSRLQTAHLNLLAVAEERDVGTARQHADFGNGFDVGKAATSKTDEF